MFFDIIFGFIRFNRVSLGHFKNTNNTKYTENKLDFDIAS